MLIDQGYLELKDKISKHWPEFTGEGKENITILQLLGHRAFLSVDYLANTFDELKNESLLSNNLATRPIDIPKNGVVGYHCAHRDFYLAELIQRVDPKHRKADKFMEEEILKQFKDIQFYFILDEKIEAERAATRLPKIDFLLFQILPRIFFPRSFLSFFGISPWEGFFSVAKKI